MFDITDITSIDYKGLYQTCEMGVQDGINYVLFKNPVSATVIDAVKATANSSYFRGTSSAPVQVQAKLPPSLENLQVSRLIMTGHPFVRLAGISGAAAVMLGAYGDHALFLKEGLEDEKRVFETANRYHFINTLGLLAVPLCRYPVIAGSLFTGGIFLFCGTCYYYSFTGSHDFKPLTPIGGTLLICAWLSMVL